MHLYEVPKIIEAITQNLVVFFCALFVSTYEKSNGKINCLVFHSKHLINFLYMQSDDELLTAILGSISKIM